jgi:hypothetical protein
MNNDHIIMEAVFSARPVPGYVKRISFQCPGGGGAYNRATLFLGEINTGIWPSRLGESQIWNCKIWPWFPRDSNPRMTVLAKTRSNCKLQTRPVVRQRAPHQPTRNSLTVTKIWSWAQDGCLTPRQTGRLDVGRNITLTLSLRECLQTAVRRVWGWCEIAASLQGCEAGSRGTSTVRRYHQAEQWRPQLRTLVFVW